MDDDIVVKLREILKQWDDGLAARWEVERQIHELSLDKFLEAIEKGETYQRMGSCCCSSHPPDRAFKIEMVMKPHGFTAKRIDE